MIELTPTQIEYVEWRADPNRTGSKEAWAADHGITARTLRQWDHTPWFRDSLERRLAERNIAPDRIQEILDRLWREARDGDTQAARIYFQEIERIRPPAPAPEDNAIASLSDEELELAWRDGLAALKARNAERTT